MLGGLLFVLIGSVFVLGALRWWDAFDPLESPLSRWLRARHETPPEEVATMSRSARAMWLLVGSALTLGGVVLIVSGLASNG